MKKDKKTNNDQLYTAATLKLKNHVVKVEENIEDNTMGKIKSTKEQALIYKTQRRTLKIEGHLYLYVVIYRGCRFKLKERIEDTKW
jgi:hypothetical protein